ncbi:MAG: 2-amino-4-hydroxy-6-hydroxymethyldihydropteridine diphosphokinase [Acidobacteriota bacterium]|nr:2-amino-4-hydroxy-6-hydroxymethyldihydropteridine diphosphokinase [Acidobacteriota bacterium]MDH3523661.1 2-amino-4-hydroxy-6-hydroxymethyldihydropteridine diphosphokinase [Acidobacteriota bacterium]
MDSPASFVAIGLGANLGDRERLLADAVRALRGLLTAVQVGRLYESAAVGGPAQPPYLNSALVGRTRLAPEPLLAVLKFLERQAGRRRGERWGPRPLDLDLLLHGDTIRDSPELVLPHPRLRRRAFVLAPLADAAPELSLPPDGAPVRSLLAALAGARELVPRPWAEGAP